MAYNIQSRVWSFITAYKRVTNQELHYLDLVQDKRTLQSVIESVKHFSDPQLMQAINDIQKLIDSGEIEFSKNKRNKKKKSAVKIKRNTINDSDESKDFEVNFYKEYAVFLKRLLEANDITIVHREELDFFCRRKNLSDKKAIKIERKIRKDLELADLNWDIEIRSAVQRFFSLHGEVNDIDRIVLYNTYVKKDRVASADLEKMIVQESTRFTKQESKQNSSLRFYAIAAAVALLSFAVLGLYFKDSGQALELAEENQIPKAISVAGSIKEDTVWRAETVYTLTSTVYVENKARLTIEPGTKVLGDFGSALIVTRDAELYARGQKGAPVIFTSAKPEGKRQRGDWGGVVLLGNASINRPLGNIEGVPEDDIRGRFGGQDDNGSCGVLEYVRIEFAGFEVFQDNELNGLTLGGCGRNTIVRHVQVHRAADDGIEMFGGLADLKNVVITGAKDDSLDWDMGWRGRVQFMVIQQHEDVGDNGFEADNWSKFHDAEPRSNPTMYNVTMVGSANIDSGQRAMNLRRGTAGQFYNFVVAGHSKEFLDIRDDATASLAREGGIQLSHSVIYNIGKNGSDYFSVETGDSDDDNGFIESNFVVGQESNRLGLDPLLLAAQDVADPSFIPLADSPVSLGYVKLPEAEFWDESANYLGAIRPGTQRGNDWLSGWSDFPIN